MRNVATLVFAVMLSWEADAGTFRGLVSAVEDRAALPSDNQDQCFWRLGSANSRGKPEPAVVLLEGEVTRSAAPISTASPAIEIKGYGLWPAITAVTTGSVLTFRNLDNHSYSCRGSEGPNMLRIEEIKPGSTYEQRFLSDGIVEVRCHSYPFMRATILVVNSPLWATVDHTGAATLNNVPEGSYQAKVFVNGSWRWSTPVKVPAQGVVEMALGPGNASGTTPTTEPAQPVPAAVPPEKTPAVPEKVAPPISEKPAAATTPVSKPAPDGAPSAGGKNEPTKEKPAAKPTPVKKPPQKKPGGQEAEPATKDGEPEIEIEEE